MIMRRQILLVVYGLLWWSGIFSACARSTEVKDTLAYSHQDLADRSYEHELDSSRAVVYANEYLRRAKQEKDRTWMADEYLLLSKAYTHTEKGIEYADSIILIAKDIENNERYPAEGYLQKGIQQYYQAQYNVVSENFITTNN